jgi:beta-glucosidase-like glycosyl hydrolase
MSTGPSLPTFPERTVTGRTFIRAKRSWGFIAFRRSIESSTQVTVPVAESAARRLIAANSAGLSIPVDGAVDPAHPMTTSATMIAQVIRSAVGFQALLMSDDVSMRNALAGGITERICAVFAACCDTSHHSNDNAGLDALTARVTTASA